MAENKGLIEIIHGNRKIDDELAYFTEDIQELFREVVEGAGLKLNRGGILSDVEVEYYNNGSKAQLQAILMAIGRGDDEDSH